MILHGSTTMPESVAWSRFLPRCSSMSEFLGESPDSVLDLVPEYDDAGAADNALVEALKAQPLAPYAALAAASGLSESTVGRRLREWKRAGRVRVRARSSRAVRGDRAWYLELEVPPGRADGVALALATKSGSTWIRVNSSRTRVTAGLVGTGEGVNSVLATVAADPRVRGIKAHEILHEWWAHPELEIREPVRRLDPLDLQLLALLEEDARAESAALGTFLGVDATTVARHRRRLAEEGVMVPWVEVAEGAPGHRSETLFWITVTPGHYEAVGEKLARHPGVRYAVAISEFPGLLVVAELTAREVLRFLDGACALPGVVTAVPEVMGPVFKRLRPTSGPRPGAPA